MRYAVRVYDRSVGKRSHDHVVCFIEAVSREAATDKASTVDTLAGDSVYVTAEPEPSGVERELRRDLAGTVKELESARRTIQSAKGALKVILAHWDERSEEGLRAAITDVIEEIL
jgi:hypothetical protein